MTVDFSGYIREMFIKYFFQYICKIFPAKIIISCHSSHFENIIKAFKNGNIKCSSAKVINRDDFVLDRGGTEGVGNRGRGRLVDDF